LADSAELECDSNKRLARLNSYARTLTSSYRSGNRSEYVLREGAPRPRFFTLRECARLQGFPDDFKVDGNGALANWHRAYHQLGNAVCPVVVAAIAASVLVALGKSPAEPRNSNSLKLQVNNGGSVLAPALELLEAASPSPDGMDGKRTSLRSLCSSFLRGDASGPMASRGRGRDLQQQDIDLLKVQLASGFDCAQVDALFTIGRVLYMELQDSAPARCSKPIAEAGLVPLVVDCLKSSTFEVRHLAVVALAILSRTSLGKRLLAALGSVLQQVERELRELTEPSLDANAPILKTLCDLIGLSRGQSSATDLRNVDSNFQVDHLSDF